MDQSLGRPPHINDLRPLVSCLVLTYLALRYPCSIIARLARPVLSRRVESCVPQLVLFSPPAPPCPESSSPPTAWPVPCERPSRGCRWRSVLASALWRTGSVPPCSHRSASSRCSSSWPTGASLPAGPRLLCPPSGSSAPQPLCAPRSGSLHRPRRDRGGRLPHRRQAVVDAVHHPSLVSLRLLPPSLQRVHPHESWPLWPVFHWITTRPAFHWNCAFRPVFGCLAGLPDR